MKNVKYLSEDEVLHLTVRCKVEPALTSLGLTQRSLSGLRDGTAGLPGSSSALKLHTQDK